MKQVQLKIYKFNELPEDVKEKVIENWRNQGEYHWSDKYIKSCIQGSSSSV